MSKNFEVISPTKTESKLGLMNGKLSQAINLAQVGRGKTKMKHVNLANKIVVEVCDEISVNTGNDFENGLAGIGWGFEYLSFYNHIDLNVEDVLWTIDQMLKEDIFDCERIGLLNGLIGYGCYYLKRFNNNYRDDQNIETLIHLQMLTDILEELEKKIAKVDLATFINCNNECFSSTLNISDNAIFNPRKNVLFNAISFKLDYQILLFFLLELRKTNLFNYKVGQIIHNLIAPLAEEKTFPADKGSQSFLMVAVDEIIKADIKYLNKRLLCKIKSFLWNSLFTKRAERFCDLNLLIEFNNSGMLWIIENLFSTELKKTKFLS